MPHTDAEAACSQVLTYLSAIPTWPQLPKRSFLENMYVQFSPGFPGVVVEGERIYVDRSQNLDEPLGQLYVAYLENRLDQYAIAPDYAAGLHAFLASPLGSPLGVKGQVTGPVSWGLTVADQERRPMLYDDILADALAKHLRLKAAWQERALGALSPTTIIFIDEPYMSAFGSAFAPLSRERVIALLEEVLGGLRGHRGIHCCGNTDWSVLLDTSADILSLDAYSYAHTLALYPAEVRDFLERDGVIAWGIIPNEETALAEETVKSLVSRLEEAMAALSRKGIPFDRLVDKALITPSCGLGALSPEGAARALELTAEVSAEMRRRYARA